MPSPRHDITRRTFLKAGAVIGATSSAGFIDPPGESDSDGTTPSQEGWSEDDTSHRFRVETVVDGLSHPWSIAFLPHKRRLLVSERDGRLHLVDRNHDTRHEIDGTPDVSVAGQGGLLDVALHPNFQSEPWVYLTYSATNDGGESATHLGRGQLHRHQPRLENFEVLHVAGPFVNSNGHYGSRITFGEDGMLYMTTGDRQFKNFGEDHVAQDLSNELGATLRLAPDGSIPDDNPFVGDEDAEDAIFSYGHRNAQGMTIHPETGEIWQAEHGEQDGDEINRIEKGGNYGWPIATYACEYGTDTPIGNKPHEDEETVAPVYYWECGSGGFAPSGATFYDGPAFPNWRGNLFVGNLAGEYLGRFTVTGSDVEEVTPLLSDREWRLRDVEVAPDTGHLYVVVDAENAPLVRLVPERGRQSYGRGRGHAKHSH